MRLCRLSGLIDTMRSSDGTSNIAEHLKSQERSVQSRRMRTVAEVHSLSATAIPNAAGQNLMLPGKANAYIVHCLQRRLVTAEQHALAADELLSVALCSKSFYGGITKVATT